jgi:predicted PurR-regulated permease PerM
MEDRVDRLESRFRRQRLIVLLIAAILLFSVIVIGSFALVTRRTLCSFTGELHNRIIDSQQRIDAFSAFADSHPGPLFGLPHAIVIANLAQQQKTIDEQRLTLKSLTGLHC